MADELTPREQRELDAIDRALAGRGVDPELDDVAALANALHDARATPSPEYAERLDRRAAEWLAEGRPRRGRLPSQRVWLPALAATAAAAVIAVALVGGDGERKGDDRLGLAAVPEEPKALALPESAPRQDSAGGGAGGARAQEERVKAGEKLSFDYAVVMATKARVELGGKSGSVELPPGSGRLEISTEGLGPGTYTLVVEIAGRRERRRVTLDG
jgi:hypothetical protein